MDHVAIMKKEWKLVPKILNGQKTVESRWYKFKRSPINKIQAGDTLFFKNTGEGVTVKSKVTKVEVFEVLNNEEALKIMQNHALADLGTSVLDGSIVNYITNKKYAIFVYFNNVESIKPFEINKKGFGMQCAWICVEDIISLIGP